ncbi:MAG TPA: methyltransferase [Ferruginibacter sp.]|nr:methyltransferase [Ferruginibacter sp.]
MKICTDSCLFAAIVANEKFKMKRCLDIGTGSGLLSLMLAQKNSEVHIDAVEIDAAAALQAVDNINASPWGNRIKVMNDDISSLTLQPVYDFIICTLLFMKTIYSLPMMQLIMHATILH